MPITYDTYTFQQKTPSGLKELFTEYNDIFNDTEPWPNVEAAWRLDKPVSLLEILPTPPHKRVATFLEQLSTFFYFEFDGYSLYISRFAQLPQLADVADPPMVGVLFGYPLHDVAQYCVSKEDVAFVATPGEMGIRSDSETAAKREQVREELKSEALYPPDES